MQEEKQNEQSANAGQEATKTTYDQLPTKAIVDSSDLAQFQTSEAHNSILQFVLGLNESVKKKPNSTPFTISKAVESILEVLDVLDNWIREIPPLAQRSRFGNKAFCTYFERVEENANTLMKKVLPDKEYKIGKPLDEIIELISPYLLNSFGDKQRLDYGSGHELNFVMWLYCLEKLEIIGQEDYTALVIKVFAKYLEVMRHLQVQYWLEPAGSHGVWGLDDYQFLPFLWGSAQLIDHKHIRPKGITSSEIIEGFSKEYMYLRCIQFINQVKNGSFFEHSPLLYDISGAKSWLKVNEGMIKMFKVEVLNKLPIMKHFFFGFFIPLELVRNPNAEEQGKHGHSHGHNHAEGESCEDDQDDKSNNTTDKPKYRFQSCCVQRIPSAIAAKALEGGLLLETDQ